MVADQLMCRTEESVIGVVMQTAVVLAHIWKKYKLHDSLSKTLMHLLSAFTGSHSGTCITSCFTTPGDGMLRIQTAASN